MLDIVSLPVLPWGDTALQVATNSDMVMGFSSLNTQGTQLVVAELADCFIPSRPLLRSHDVLTTLRVPPSLSRWAALPLAFILKVWTYSAGCRFVVWRVFEGRPSLRLSNLSLNMSRPTSCSGTISFSFVMGALGEKVESVGLA